MQIDATTADPKSATGLNVIEEELADALKLAADRVNSLLEASPDDTEYMRQLLSDLNSDLATIARNKRRRAERAHH